MNGSIVEFPLTKGKVAIIDAEYFDLVNKYSWNYQNGGYASTSVGGRKNKKSILMHRLITGVSSNYYVDHINGDKLDNRINNLRICTASQNLGNSKIRKDNTSGYKGVTLHSQNKNWIARIHYQKKHIHLGTFDNPHDAARMYNFWAVAMYGEFARLNVINEEYFANNSALPRSQSL